MARRVPKNRRCSFAVWVQVAGPRSAGIVGPVNKP